MAGPLVIPLTPIRTDGWLERIGEGIPSFQALCDIVGVRFFAFAMITGARITSLLVDRRNPDETIVEFVTGGGEGDVDPADIQKLTLSEFRLRLVSALVSSEPFGNAPQRPTDVEAVQLHIGVRYLLLAPLYGYALEELRIQNGRSEIRLLHDGLEETYTLTQFRMRMAAHVREELARVARPSRGAIDLSLVEEADRAAAESDWLHVIELLGSWPAPLAIFLRTPEGQLLPPETRALLARAMGLLGTACISLGEHEKGEEVLRLSVQYAGEGSAAADSYLRMGEAFLSDGRVGEAIAPLRRAVRLGAPPAKTWPLLAQCYARRGRLTAAYAAILECREAGLSAEAAERLLEEAEDSFGPVLRNLEEALEKPGP